MGRSNIIQVDDRYFVFNNKAFNEAIKNKADRRKHITIEKVISDLSDFISIDTSSIKHWYYGHNGPSGGFDDVKTISEFFSMEFCHFLSEIKDKEPTEMEENTDKNRVAVQTNYRNTIHGAESAKNDRELIECVFKELMTFTQMMVDHGPFSYIPAVMEYTQFYYANKSMIDNLRFAIFKSSFSSSEETRKKLHQAISGYIDVIIYDKYPEPLAIKGINYYWGDYRNEQTREQAIDDYYWMYLKDEEYYLESIGVSFEKNISEGFPDCADFAQYDSSYTDKKGKEIIVENRVLYEYGAGSCDIEIKPIEVWGFRAYILLESIFNMFFADELGFDILFELYGIEAEDETEEE